MASTVLKITDDDDDEISILCSTPPGFKSGATKADAISVEDYSRTVQLTIDLTLDADADDDVVEIPSKRQRFYKGESSNSKSREETVFNRSFTCEICTDDKSIRDSFQITGCDHRYCTQCISKYVAAKLQENTAEIRCPVPRCGSRLNPHLCRTILPKEVFERWGDVLCEAMVLGKKKLYCPYKDCSAPLIDDGTEELKESECLECRRLFCVPCKAPWHVGISCAEFRKLGKDERSNEDIKLLKLAEHEKWVRCPRCRVFVSKRSGCSIMSCRFVNISLKN